MTVLDRPYEVLFNESQIRERVKELGTRITRDYSGQNPMLIGILKGSVVFLSDLIRSIGIPIFLDFIAVSSYGCNMESSGIVRIQYDLKSPIENRDVLLVEDIVDTGLTLKYLRENLMTRRPNSVRICAFLDKKEARKPGLDLQIDYTGFEVPNRFLVGYGLDYDEKYRNLPFVAAITRGVHRNGE